MTDSAFDKENIDHALLIQTTRVYDAMIALLRAVDSESAAVLIEAHSKGILLSPPPSFVLEEE